MKKLFYLSVITTIMAACSSGPHYVINGKIEGADSVKFLLQIREAGKVVTMDSAVAYKGSFKMKGGAVKYPDLVLLSAQVTPRDPRMRTQFYLENAEITITGKLDSLYGAKITGSKTMDEYNGFVKSLNVIDEKFTKIDNDYQLAEQSGDTAKVVQLKKEIEAGQKELTQIQKDFVKNNPSSFAAPQILAGITYDMEGSEIETYINAMDTAVANTETIRNLKEMVEVMKTVAIGQKAPDFTLNDPEGNPVSLYSKVGSKLLLIDFWAAWCGPCRQENPNVVKLYNEFNEKGFDIFGVSLDRTKDAWVKAIADDKLTWTHVSDLQYWNNAAAKLYGVHTIPANFLLDENGMIIGRNLRGDALSNKLKEVLGGK
ncbi:MAG: TlpA disulfide reductase family protein [Bacteroidia bacterium]|nr:TlpA disulfide reductase family protein [Bacteroidia bacterium]